jgi:hypothetical protein
MDSPAQYQVGATVFRSQYYAIGIRRLIELMQEAGF